MSYGSPMDKKKVLNLVHENDGEDDAVVRERVRLVQRRIRVPDVRKLLIEPGPEGRIGRVSRAVGSGRHVAILTSHKGCRCGGAAQL